jgi:hypothetical protein
VVPSLFDLVIYYMEKCLSATAFLETTSSTFILIAASLVHYQKMPNKSIFSVSIFSEKISPCTFVLTLLLLSICEWHDSTMSNFYAL